MLFFFAFGLKNWICFRHFHLLFAQKNGMESECTKITNFFQHLFFWYLLKLLQKKKLKMKKIWQHWGEKLISLSLWLLRTVMQHRLIRWRMNECIKRISYFVVICGSILCSPSWKILLLVNLMDQLNSLKW